MVKIIEDLSNADCNIIAIGIEVGECFFVNHLIPNGIQELAEVEDVEGSSSRKIIAKKGLVLVVEGLHSSKKGCKHIRFMRESRKGKLIRVGLAKSWPRLRKALQYAKLPTVHVPGGFGCAVRYADEIAVPDYTMDGSSGWIIRRSEIGGYLDALPPLQDSGVIRQTWIETVGWVNASERNLRPYGHNPMEETPLSYKDIGRGYLASCNRCVMRIEYDAASKLVKKIIGEQDGKEYGATVCQLLPVIRYIEVGKRIPGFCVFKE